ncbi:MAG: hypothetical protein AAFV25_22815, partial [Bacteroidota bacterium]
LACLFCFPLFSFAQHPNVFLKDVYDLGWCQDKGIKVLHSGGGVYELTNGVPISKKSRDVTFEQDGRLIKQTMGKVNFKVQTFLTADLKRLSSISMGPISTYYFYNEQNQLAYKINHSNRGNSNYRSGREFSMEEVEWDAEGKMTQKIIYAYDKPLTSFMEDVARLQSENRRLCEKWEYIYNEKGELQIIKIRQFDMGIDDPEKTTTLVKVSHENGLPVSMNIQSANVATQAFGNNRTFEYEF